VQPPQATARYQQGLDPYHHEEPAAPYPPEPYEQVPSARERRISPYHEPPVPEESPIAYQRERDRRADRANTISNTIHVVTALIALIFVLHIVFVLSGANQSSGIVSFVYLVAKVLVLGFGDVFTPSDAKIGLVLNYGLAAIIYFVIGRLIARTLRHR
jgi:hypothetical protein